MDHIEGILTKRRNPVSFGIRCATPVSITTPSPASHILTLDGNTGYCIEANMFHGVRRVTVEDALNGAVEVARVRTLVPCAEEGLEWGREAARKKIKYDWGGALGLGLAPGRNWQDESKFFCHELHATIIAKAGRLLFVNNAHVNAQMLLALRA